MPEESASSGVNLLVLHCGNQPPTQFPNHFLCVLGLSDCKPRAGSGFEQISVPGVLTKEDSLLLLGFTCTGEGLVGWAGRSLFALGAVRSSLERPGDAGTQIQPKNNVPEAEAGVV